MPKLLAKMSYPAVVALVVAAGSLLRWTGGQGAVFSDDYVHHAVLDGVAPVSRAPLDLYTLVSGDEREFRQLMDFGSLPWWSHPKIRLAMMRPLSSALIVFDHWVLGSNPGAWHLHSLLWWAFFMVAVSIVLRQLLPKTMAATAVLLLAVEEGNVLLVGWLASRCALVSLSLGVLGLWAHLRWRKEGKKGALVGSIVLFSLALLGGEWAMPVFGYVIAYELLGAQGTVGTRVRALLPVGILAGAFVAVASALGYRTQFSGIYTSPLDTPVLFLLSSAARIPALLAELLAGIPARWWHSGSPWRSFFLSLDLFSPPVWKLIPDWKSWHVLLGLGAVAAALPPTRWALKICRPQLSREVSWLLLGAGLALIPMAAPFVGSRSVVPTCLGFTAACSVLFWEAGRYLWSTVRRRLLAPSPMALAIVLTIPALHLGLASWRSWSGTRFLVGWHNVVAHWVLSAEVDENKIADQEVFVVNALEAHAAMFAPYLRHFFGRSMPRSWRALSAAPNPLALSRPAARVLDIDVLGGTLLASDPETLFRPERYPLNVGHTVVMRGLEVEVLKLLRGKPISMRFRFDRNLDHPSYVFLQSTPQTLKRLRLPQVGQALRLPRIGLRQ